MSEDIKPQSAFTVVLNPDGSFFTQPAEAGEFVERTATTFDIYRACKEIATEIENQILADRVAKTVIAALQPADLSSENKTKIIDALSDRGIVPPLN
jgi:hypothetical protein